MRCPEFPPPLDQPMLQVLRRAADREPATETLTLPFEERQKSRLRARLASGREVVLLLPRGTVLRHGERLEAEDGTVIRVEAAPERVSRATSRNPLVITRGAYHLGNRHVPLQIEERRLAYLHDHVLDAMVRQLGLEVTVEIAPFEPEAGAYGHHHGAGNGHHER